MKSMNGSTGAMLVRLKGLNHVNKRLSDGRTVTYYYAWRGGPRLDGKPGTPEFAAAYQAAVSAKIAAPAGRLQAIIDKYEASAEFRGLMPRTQQDYGKLIMAIEKEFGDMPLASVANKRARAEFKEWRDELSARSLRQADYAWTVLARILSWALDRGLIDANPCERGGRLYAGTRVDRVWSDDDEARWRASASGPLKLAFLLAIWTGQRQGDLLRLPWAAYDGQSIRLRQSKTGITVRIPVAAPLKAGLDEAAKTKQSPVILTNSDGRPWTEDGFRSSWAKASAKAAITDLTFNDLRGSAVTRLALAGCTEAEITAITGHSLGDVRSILDAHYLHRDPQLAESAIRKLEQRTNLSNRPSNRPDPV
jgi:integrase